MWRVTRILAWAYGIALALSGSVTLWVLGGPTEACAVARIDGWDFVPLLPVRTCYPASFSHANYRRVADGDSPDVVRATLGEPLAIAWSLHDGGDGPFVWFEPVAGRWSSTYAFEVDVPKGTPMTDLAALRDRVTGETWEYSRSCIPDDSKRMRSIVFDRGRVTLRASGVYYD